MTALRIVTLRERNETKKTYTVRFLDTQLLKMQTDLLRQKADQRWPGDEGDGHVSTVTVVTVLLAIQMSKLIKLYTSIIHGYYNPLYLNKAA